MNFEDKYKTIISKTNINFLNCLLNKEELKIIFYRSFYRFSDEVHTLGYPIKNKTDSECFRITGFNIFMRMQEKIWDEIDNLSEEAVILALIDKVRANRCLNNAETIIFNKYLLLQTAIELTSNEILNNLYSDVSMDIPVKRQNLLNERFKLLSISSDSGLYVDPILNAKDPINYNKLLFLEKFIDIFDSFSKNNYDYSNEFISKLNESLSIEGLKKRISLISETFEGNTPDANNSALNDFFSDLCLKFRTDILPFLTVKETELSTKISEIANPVDYDSAIDEKIKTLDDLYEEILSSEITIDVKRAKRIAYKAIVSSLFDRLMHENYKKEINLNKFENLQFRLREINDMQRYINETVSTDLSTIPPQFEAFTPETCEFDKLRKINNSYLNKILAFENVPGSISLIFLNYYMKYAINDTFARQVIIKDGGTDKNLDELKAVYDISGSTAINDYLIINLGGGQNLYPPKDIFNSIKNINVRHSDSSVKTYKLVGVAYNCGGTHSVSSVCYGNGCLSDPVIHEQINEDQTYKFKLEDPLLGTKLCSPDHYRIELLLYEPIETVSRLQEKLNIFKGNYTAITDIEVSGGNSIYYHKYLKYKQKYLSLKDKKN